VKKTKKSRCLFSTTREL